MASHDAVKLFEVKSAASCATGDRYSNVGSAVVNEYSTDTGLLPAEKTLRNV